MAYEAIEERASKHSVATGARGGGDDGCSRPARKHLTSIDADDEGAKRNSGEI